MKRVSSGATGTGKTEVMRCGGTEIYLLIDSFGHFLVADDVGQRVDYHDDTPEHFR